MAEEVVITIKVQGQRELERSLSTAEKSFESWAKKIQSQTSILSQGMGTALGNAITGALNLGLRAFESFGKSAVDVLKNSLQSAANLQDIAIAFEVMLGSGEKAQKLLEDLSDFAKITPFNLTDLQKYTQQLLAFGVAEEDIISTMSDLGNIAAGVGRDKLPQLIYALGQVKAKTVLSGEELKQFTETGVPLIEELARVTGHSIGDIVTNTKDLGITYDEVRQALGNLSGDGGKFEGLMDKQSKTWNGLVSNMQDYRDQLFRTIGGITEGGQLIEGGLLDVMQGKLSTLMTWLNDNEVAIKNLATTIGTELAGKFETAFNWVVENKEEIIQAITDITGALGDMVNLVGDAIGTVEDLGTGISEALDLGITYTGMGALEFRKFEQEIENAGYKVEDLGADWQTQFQKIVASTKNSEDAMLIFRNRVDGAKKSTDNLGYGGSTAMNNLAGNTANARDQMSSLEQYAWRANTAIWAAVNASASLNSSAARALGFASGGIVPNAANGFTVGSGTGDRNQVNVNGGEMIINTQQQNALFAFIKKLANGGGGVTNNFGSVNFGGERPKGQEMNMFTQLLMNI